ncbi:MAG: hypothetical protein AB1403_23295 [Candidatus Riflebacteria bacterium]
MKNSIIFFLFLMFIAVALSAAETKPIVEVFFKKKAPSQKTLAEVKKVFEKFSATHQIVYYDILDESSRVVHEKYRLVTAHFPFAVVVNGRIYAKIADKEVCFIDFPLFMKGIGRHEGNWSLDDLKKVLIDPGLMQEKVFEAVLHENDQADSHCEQE